MDGSVAAITIGGSVIEARDDQIVTEGISVAVAPAGESSTHEGRSHGDPEEKLEVGDVATAPALPLPPLVSFLTPFKLFLIAAMLVINKLDWYPRHSAYVVFFILNCRDLLSNVCIVRWVSGGWSWRSSAGS